MKPTEAWGKLLYEKKEEATASQRKDNHCLIPQLHPKKHNKKTKQKKKKKNQKRNKRKKKKQHKKNKKKKKKAPLGEKIHDSLLKTYNETNQTTIRR